MALIKFNPKSSLNKAFLKVKPNRVEIEKFKSHLIALLDNINETESEEFHKNLISDFLKKTYYDPSYYINTKGRNDLVIHNGKETKDSVAVIIEAKKPTNKAEMLKQENINTKAFQELVLYFLRERITHKNHEIKCLVATNINEWFIFDATVFEKNFAQNKALVAKFNDFVNGRLSGDTTDFFYKEIAQPAIAAITTDIEFTYFDIRDYDKPLRNENKQDDNKLISLFKLLSPEHLLKLPFINDSNSLDKRFYSELLHIIGLIETKEGTKKLIQRKNIEERNTGSLLENAIEQIEARDKLAVYDNPAKFGVNKEERLFNIGLELVITWINRILFLKLLEAQLLSYHKGNNSYAFLNHQKITNFDDLDSLFFQVLAKKSSERKSEAQKLFTKVPYLNSSLFEPTDIEHKFIFISNLRDEKKIPVLASTVLKDSNGRKLNGELTTLEYLFRFLEAYDFASDGVEEIQEENKSLINASVLGLIFEKINGYKDGSFFTPGFITMYMCRETIRRTVINKFNETKNWKCKTIDDLYDAIEDRKEANEIINSIKICDPAVGSGHFLVSALNEIIALKSDLKVLLDREGKRLKEYQVEVINDELIITDEDGEFCEYKPLNSESQRIQEALFHEKQTIIESCLFGVDINPNSVKICTLRLWIELLKNAYYKNNDELETLPNIDINIKCGNSLISRFPLNSDLKEALKKSKTTISSYRSAVDTYRNASSKEQKREMEKLIEGIKNNFRVEIDGNDPKIRKLIKLQNELGYLLSQSSLFDETKQEKKIRKQKLTKLENETTKLNQEIEQIKSNKIYHNAFEWRFEFPEVLNNDGEFVGFDVVIGNPPYGVKFETSEKDFFKNAYGDVHQRTPESYNYFIKQFSTISSDKALCCLIIPSSFLNQAEFEKSRETLLRKHSPFLVLNLGDAVFEDVSTPTCIVGFDKKNIQKTITYDDLTIVDRDLLSSAIQNITNEVEIHHLANNQSSSLIYRPYTSILEKCYNKNPTLKDLAEEVATGVSSGLDRAYVYLPEEIKENKLEKDLLKKLVVGGEIHRFYINPISGKELIYITDENNVDDFVNIKSVLIKYKEQLLKRREAANGKIEWYSLNWPRRKKLFETPKILIRQTANRIMAAYDEENWYCLKSGIIVQLPEKTELSYKYLLGVLNSSLMDFLYKDLVNEDNRIFPEVKPIQLFKLPIKIASDTMQNSISNLIDKIVFLKKEGSNTSEFEKELDKLVYQVYELTEEEIKTLEN